MPATLQQAVQSPPKRSSRPQILIPFDRREAISAREYIAHAGGSPASARETIHVQGLGRKVGGRWIASKVAVAMYFDGDREALRAYWAGDRTSDLVRRYFERFGIDPSTLGRGV